MEFEPVTITPEALQAQISERWRLGYAVGRYSDLRPVPSGPLPPQHPDEGGKVQLVRHLDQDNGGLVTTGAKADALSRWKDLWYGAYVVNDRSAALTDFALHEYDPLNAADAWAIVKTAWRLHPELTQRRFMEADSERMPVSMSGALVVDSTQADAEQTRFASRSDIAIIDIDGSAIDDKPTLLREVATALSFPSYFGMNWDALDECLGDMTWLPAAAFLLIVRNARLLWDRCPGNALMFVDACQRSARSWQFDGVPFRLLLVW